MFKDENIKFDSPEYVEGVCRIKRIELASAFLEKGNVLNAKKTLEYAVDCEYADLAEKFGNELEASDEGFYRSHGVRRSPKRLISYHASTVVDVKFSQYAGVEIFCQPELPALADLFNEFLSQSVKRQVNPEKVAYRQYREAVEALSNKLVGLFALSRQRAIALIESAVIRYVNKSR